METVYLILGILHHAVALYLAIAEIQRRKNKQDQFLLRANARSLAETLGVSAGLSPCN